MLDTLAFAGLLGPAEIEALGVGSLIPGLEDRRLVRSDRNGRRLEIRIGHPLHGEVLRTQTTGWRARVLAQSLIDTVEATGARRQGDAVRLATWRLEMGAASPELTTSAAMIANSRLEFDLAERFARAAIDAGGGFDAALVAAQIASRPGGGDIEGELERLALFATTDAQRARLAIARLEYRVFHGGDPAETLGLAQAALDTITDPAWREEIEARRMAVDVLLDAVSPIKVLKLSQLMLERAHSGSQTWAFFQTAYAGMGLARQGRLNDALEIFERGYEAQITLTSPLVWSPWKGVWHHLWFKVEALRHLGRLEEAQQLATEQHSRALAEHSVDAQAYFAWRLAGMAAETGAVRKAAFHGHEATALLRSGGRDGVACSAAASLALALAIGGDSRGATTALSAGGYEETLLFFPIEFRQAQAWSAVAAGDLRRAREVLTDAADTASRTGDLLGESFTLYDLARLGHPELVADRLDAVAEQIDGCLATARAEHVRGLAKGDGDALERVSTQFERMGATLLAAEAAADAAVAWRLADRARLAKAAEVRAVLLSGRCEGARTPALQRIDARARLTPAERQVAMLAVTGRSNKEIADELFLSVRTVGNHLQRVYEKLGISSRKALVEALDDHLLDTGARPG